MTNTVSRRLALGGAAASLAVLGMGRTVTVALNITDPAALLTTVLKMRGAIDGTGPVPFRYNEMTTYNAKISDLEKPDMATVPTSIQYQSIVGFSPWNAMDGIDAMNMGRGSGTRVARVEDFPPYYLELTEKYHADVLHDPMAILYGPRQDRRE